jgi:hypothetical protein
MLSVIMISVAFSYCYADCLYAAFLYAACPYAECHSQEEACPMPEWSILWFPTLILISQPYLQHDTSTKNMLRTSTLAYLVPVSVTNKKVLYLRR